MSVSSSFLCRSVVAAVVAVASLGCLPSSGFASIVVTDASTYVEVRNDNAFFNFNNDSSSSTIGATVTVTTPAFSSATSVYGPSGLSVGVDQSRGNLSYSLGYGRVYFTAQNNDTYSISGSYTNSDGFGYIQSFLFDIDLDEYVYEFNEVADGPSTQTLAGTGLNGSLIGGHNYEWYFYAMTRHNQESGIQQAFGSGSIQFAAIPEPSSLLICGASVLVGLGGRRRKAC